MKRKKFIHNMSILCAGFVLAPWKLATARTTTGKLRLPPTSIHIPHGNFATSKIEEQVIYEMKLSISSQVFMKNGLTPSEKDLTIFTLKKGTEIMHVSVSGDGNSKVGELTGIDVTMKKGPILISSVTHSLSINPQQHTAELSQF